MLTLENAQAPFQYLTGENFQNAFKTKLKQTLFEILASEDCYIDLSEIVQKVKLNLFSS